METQPPSEVSPPSPLSPSLSADIASGKKVSFSAVVTDGATPFPDSDLPEVVVTDGVADLEIPEEIFVDVEPLWKCFVVGYFMGEAPHVGSIHSTVNRLWSNQGKSPKIDVQFLDKKTVLFRIEDEQMRGRVLRRRYWHIANIPLMVTEWNPETAQSPPDFSAMPLWVDFGNVPGYLFSGIGLKFLSRAVGHFVKLHPLTERCLKLDVARVLVEVNLQKPLPQVISFKNREGDQVRVSVKYPWLPPRCSVCSSWGHCGKECSSGNKVRILSHSRTENSVLMDDAAATKEHQPVGSSSEAVMQLLTELENTKVGVRNRKEKVQWSKVVWFSHGVPRFAFITWLAIRDRLATGTRTRIWGQVQPCLFCGEPDESRDHLFFACPYTFTLWIEVLGTLWGAPPDPDWDTTLSTLSSNRFRRLEFTLLRLAFQATVYYIWRERNERQHSHRRRSVQELFKTIDKTIRARLLSTRYFEQPKYHGILQTWFKAHMVHIPI